MAIYRFSKSIAAPIDRTFEMFADFRNADQRIEAIKKVEVLTDGPVGKGTRFRETRVMFGREATEDLVVTDFQPGRSYSVSAHSCGCDMVCRFDFSSQPTGTHVEMEMQTKPITLLARIMSPLSFFFAGACKKAIEKDLDDLKLALEGPTATGQPATA